MSAKLTINRRGHGVTRCLLCRERVRILDTRNVENGAGVREQRRVVECPKHGLRVQVTVDQGAAVRRYIPHPRL